MPVVELTVVGSVNLDLVARAERLPRPGETVSDAAFARHPGGKGANQAVAAARHGAAVTFVGGVGGDAVADEALAGLREAGVTTGLQRGATTGVALIVVDDEGENTIVVAPGATASCASRGLPERCSASSKSRSRRSPLQPREPSGSSSMPLPLAPSRPSSSAPPNSWSSTATSWRRCRRRRR